MLTVVCPHCNAQGRAPEKLAGRTVPCPKCKQPLTVPALADDDVMDLLNEPVAEPRPEPPAKSKYVEEDEDDSPYRIANAPQYNSPPKRPAAPAKLGGFSGGSFEPDDGPTFEPDAKPKKKKKKSRRRYEGTSHDPRKEPRMWLFVVTLLPLFLFALVPPKSPLERLGEDDDALVEAE